MRSLIREVAGSWDRTLAIAEATVRETLRGRPAALVLGLMIALLLLCHVLAGWNLGRPEIKFLAELGAGLFAVFGSILAASLAAESLLGDCQVRNRALLLAKPVGRGEFLAGKFAGLAAILGILTAGWAAGLCLLLLWRQETLGELGEEVISEALLPGLGGVLGWTALRALQLLLVASMGMFVSCRASSPSFASATVLLVVAVCHLRHLFSSSGGGSGSFDSVPGGEVLLALFPDFSVFSAGEDLLLGRSEAFPWAVAGYAGSYVIFFLALAWIRFQRTEAG